ncbi:hypothetical protein SAY87_023938 [Trapa incisa]|uniref:Glycosyltransferase 61 catalytic domain-containing protein n=1 Tax=Trapa incisa TaxID=236973 RepID=A0AAN7KYM3_9MYRT|nr:hypothetical protein SAY87_023938 [Trapa incisa]
MVHYQRYHPWRKGDAKVYDVDEESHGLGCANSAYFKRKRPKLFYLLIISLLSCSFLFAPQISSSSSFSLFHTFGVDGGIPAHTDFNAPPCSSMSTGTVCCDRSSSRSDVCLMKGDIRTSSASSSVFLYTSKGVNFSSSNAEEEAQAQLEKIRPYTRKWEIPVMDSIDELKLVAMKGAAAGSTHKCDISYDVPAVFFSTGGYTGNVYHEFNDGILPLYITSQHFKRKVVFVILEYHNWWIMKYGNILSHLTDYPPVDYRGDNRTYCFPEAIVGLRIHDELTVNSTLMEGNKGIFDFRNVLDRAYWPRIRGLIRDEEREMKLKKPTQPLKKQPKLVILSRNGSRAILNEEALVNMAEKIGFSVEVLRPGPKTELAKIYRALNSSDVMVGVHGAAMTHFLFMRPRCWFIQVIPLGTDWAAETYYGDPSRKLGLNYIGYKILPRESSLYNEYDRSDPVLADPESVNQKGWEFTKKIYLDRQSVSLDLERFGKRLIRAYDHSLRAISRNAKTRT